MPSVRGIYYNLDESIYSFKFNNLTFYFSSKLYLKKFTDKYIGYLKTETFKLNSRYKCYMYADDMLLIDLYRKIEKRGFRVLYNDVEISGKCHINSLLDYENSR